VREEAGALVVGAGVAKRWISDSEGASFGPTLTPWGAVRVQLRARTEGLMVSVAGDWRATPPKLLFQVPGYSQQSVETPTQTTDLLLSPLL
jgi:hypothetical protein